MATNQSEKDKQRESLGVQGNNSIPALSEQEANAALRKLSSQEDKEKPPAPPQQNQE